MSEEEELHNMLHTNFCLLKENNNKFDFIKGMFQTRNIKGFESVGYALLMIIDPVECKKSIPWPLLEDKSLRSEFRTKFAEFIKTTRSKYPDSSLAEIRASELQFPGGIKFLKFMFKLSTFAVELELKRLLRREEKENLLSCPKLTTGKSKIEGEVKLKMIQQERNLLQAELSKFRDHQHSAIPLLSKLEEKNNILQKNVLQARENLSSVIKSLKFEEQKKPCLEDIENQNVLKEWNEETERRVEELEDQCKQLQKLREPSARAAQLIQSLCTRKTDSSSEELCLDGGKLQISPSASKIVGNIYNSQAQLRLTALLQAVKSSMEKLVPKSSQGPPLLPQTLEVFHTLQHQQSKAEQLGNTLDMMISTHTDIINKLRPITYAKYSDRRLPEYFKYLQQIPTIEFTVPTSARKHTFSDSPTFKPPVSPRKKGNKSRLIRIARSISLQQRNANKVVASVKMRRMSGGQSFFMTPSHRQQQSFFASTAKLAPPSSRIPRFGCTTQKTQSKYLAPPQKIRKSLFGKLPVGQRENMTSVPETIKTPPKVSDERTSPEVVEISEISQPIPSLIIEQPTPRSKRRSIDVIVQRYRQLKAQMEN